MAWVEWLGFRAGGGGGFIRFQDATGGELSDIVCHYETLAAMPQHSLSMH